MVTAERSDGSEQRIYWTDDDLVIRYATQAAGDLEVALQLLTHDGPEGAHASQERVDVAFEIILTKLEAPPPPTDLIKRHGRSKHSSVANPFEAADQEAYDPENGWGR